MPLNFFLSLAVLCPKYDGSEFANSGTNTSVFSAPVRCQIPDPDRWPLNPMSSRNCYWPPAKLSVSACFLKSTRGQNFADSPKNPFFLGKVVFHVPKVRPAAPPTLVFHVQIIHEIQDPLHFGGEPICHTSCRNFLFQKLGPVEQPADLDPKFSDRHRLTRAETEHQSFHFVHSRGPGSSLQFSYGVKRTQFSNRRREQSDGLPSHCASFRFFYVHMQDMVKVKSAHTRSELGSNTRAERSSKIPARNEPK